LRLKDSKKDYAARLSIRVTNPEMKQTELTDLSFRVAEACTWNDIVTLFGERGACAGCWCMFWRIPRKQYDANRGIKNRNALKKFVQSDARPGVIAYAGKNPIGWCAVAPRSDYIGLERSRILKPVDDAPVWSISCLFVDKAFRRQGISSKLIRAAAEFAGKQGARIVEGYPVEPSHNKIADAFLWHGVSAAFLAAGFKEVLRRSEARPIMRLAIGE
jgi:GNAT superfamily N-acetyltransferase